ncbi:MAG TPA: DUF3572 domain-containing protein [Alphaproteobacteria bacterium]|nr:DUF3572 domain-containing protein [Alphaproteobacteria bacterium]
MARSISLSPRELGELCLGHLAEDPEALARFMEATGYSPAGIRAAVGSDQLDRGLIDYFAQDEPLLLALCANNAISPEDFMGVWARLNATA